MKLAKSPPWLVQLFDALQPDVRQSIQVLFQELGQGSQGRGQDVNAAFAALGQSASNLNTITAALKAPWLAYAFDNEGTAGRVVEPAGRISGIRASATSA